MKLICANFKMNLLKKEIHHYLNTIDNKINKQNTIFFPNNLHITLFSKKGYLVGSQDISFKEWGAVTGDSSIHQLKEEGITYTLLGHSERREYFNDSKFISKKMKLALENNIKIVLCIGEKESDFLNKQTFTILKQELDEAIYSNIENITNDNLIIAYEPIWSIGTGKIPTNEGLNEIILFIKEYVKKTYQLSLKVLYGGSVNLENIENLQAISSIDGYLIGGASLDPNHFLTLLNKVN